jgi:hypothetical protein
LCLRYSTSICASTAKLWILLVFVLVTLDGRQGGDRVHGVFRNSYFNWLVQNKGRYVYILANMTDKQTKSSDLCRIHFYICRQLRSNSLRWGQTLHRIFSAGNRPVRYIVRTIPYKYIGQYWSISTIYRHQNIAHPWISADISVSISRPSLDIAGRSLCNMPWLRASSMMLQGGKHRFGSIWAQICQKLGRKT